LEFIRAKYFGRDLGVPGLAWYTDVERPLDMFVEGRYPWSGEEGECEKFENEAAKSIQKLNLHGHVKGEKLRKMKRVSARRVSVTSSESGEDIKEVLKEVVRDYTAAHSRTTYAAERPAQSQKGTKAKWGEDLICFD
jgi:hypothetical protein